jgi:nucleoside phosphorylase
MANPFPHAMDLKGKTDFGIITIREDEFEAVLNRFPVESTVVGRQRYAISRLRTVSEDEYTIACVRCLEQGTNQAQEVARTLIDELDPQWILVVGIAGSLPDHEYTLGDVLLASRIHDFSVSAIIENSDGGVRHEFADMGGPMHPDIQSLLAYLPALPLDGWWNNVRALRPKVNFSSTNFYGDTDWMDKVRACLTRYFGKKSIRSHPKAFTGSVVSSGILLKATSIAQQWLKGARDIKGIEMELAGVYKAAWNSQKPVLGIRGISDTVGYKRSPDWTNYACDTAAIFAEALLRTRPITPLETKNAIPEPTREAESGFLGRSRPVGVFKDKPPNPAPIARKEYLYSNLLEVTYFPKKLYVLDTDCKDAKEVWEALRLTSSNPPGDWFYKRKAIYAFHDFSDPVWKEFKKNNETHVEDAVHWSASEERDRKSEFIELLRNCLKEKVKDLGLSYIHKKYVAGVKKTFKYLYFDASPEFAEVPTLSPKDLFPINRIVDRLRDRADKPFFQHVFDRLSDQSKGLLDNSSAAEPQEIAIAIARDLNAVIDSEFHDETAFETVKVRWPAKRLLEKLEHDRQELRSLNRMLLEDGFNWSIRRRLLRSRNLSVKSLIKVGEVGAFKPILNKAGTFQYYRHHAFRPEFLRFDGRWFLEITPTYHYTWDGFNISRFYEDYVSGIKRIEGSGAVFRQVLFWSRLLHDGPPGLMKNVGYLHLRFGELLQYPFEYGIVEKLWLNREESGSELDGNGRKRQGGRRRSSGGGERYGLFD